MSVGRAERIRRSQRNLTLAVSGVVLVIVFGGGLLWVGAKVNPTLRDDLCPASGNIAGTAIILVDATDPWTDVRRAAIDREVREITLSMPRFTRVSLHIVSPGASPEGAAAALLCNPGTVTQVEQDARDRGVPPWLITNPARARARFDSAFAGVIRDVVAGAGSSPAQDSSPIIETLRAAVLATAIVRPLSVRLISDLYQNSDLCSFYREPPCVGRSRQVADPVAGGVHGLEGAEVNVALLSPAGGDRVTRDTLMDFWYDYFRIQGAMITRVKRIEQ